VAVSKDLLAFKNHGMTTSAKRNSGQIPALTKTDTILYTEKDHFGKSQNYCSTSVNRNKYSLLMKTTCKKKTTQYELLKSIIHGSNINSEPQATKCIMGSQPKNLDIR
jgi:hypothetical protein